MKKGPTKKKGPGRPSRAEGPRLPYDQLDKLLVHGEVVTLDDGSSTVEFPSYREVADRFGVAMSVVAEYARRHNVQRRREVIQDRVQSRVEEKLIEFRAEAIAMTRDDQLRLIDKYLIQFAKAIDEGKVRCDTIADLNTAMRLREFLMGNAESRSEVHNFVLKLDELQERHRQATRRVEVTTAAERGEVPRRLPENGESMFADMDTTGEPVVDGNVEP